MINRRTVFLLLLVSACGPKPPVVTPADPNDPDATRTSARAIKLDQPATDDINWDSGDHVDWKKVTVDKPGALVVELRWDNVEASPSIDVYDPLGRAVGASPSTSGEANVKKLTALADNAGVYFVKIEATKPADKTTYSLRVHVDPIGGGDAPVVAPQVVKSPDTAPAEEDKPEPAEQPAEKDRDEVQGRIISSYMEGGALVLHLDKGTAANLGVGDHGALLAGPSGSDRVAGGEFTIAQVVDRQKSVAHCKTLKTIGRNVRVVIYPGSAK